MNKKNSQIDLDLIRHIKYNDIALVRNAITSGANVNCAEEYTLTADIKTKSALMVAVQIGNLDILQLLIDHGALVNRTPIRQSSFNPLTLAATYLNDGQDVIELLLKNGANINWESVVKETPLMMSVLFADNPNNAKILLNHGADHTKTNFEGFDALALAKSVSNVACVALLENHMLLKSIVQVGRADALQNNKRIRL